MRHGLNFSYLRTLDGHPSVCIAFLTVEGSKHITFQIATHNPKDQFNKKFARAAAGGRLAKHPVTFLAEEVDLPIHKLVYRIAKYLVHTDFREVKAGPIARGVVEGYIWDVDNGFISLNHDVPSPMAV